MNEQNDGTIHQGTVEHDSSKARAHGSLIAIFAYLGILIIIPFLTDSQKDPFVKFHLKQGVTLLIFDAIGWIVGIAIGWIPFFGGLITSLWAIFSIVFVIVGVLNVLNGQEKELPLIGKYAHLLKF